MCMGSKVPWASWGSRAAVSEAEVGWGTRVSLHIAIDPTSRQATARIWGLVLSLGLAATRKKC